MKAKQNKKNNKQTNNFIQIKLLEKKNKGTIVVLIVAYHFPHHCCDASEARFQLIAQ